MGAAVKGGSSLVGEAEERQEAPGDEVRASIEEHGTKVGREIVQTFAQSQQILAKCLRLKQELGLSLTSSPGASDSSLTNKPSSDSGSTTGKSSSTPQQLLKKLTINQKLVMAMEQERFIQTFVQGLLRQAQEQNQALR